MNNAGTNDQQKSPHQNRKKIIIKDAKGSIEVNNRIAILPQRVPERFQKETKILNLVPTFPNLIIREMICFQIVVIAVILIALFFDAPLEHRANPNNTPNPAKAPWYFLGLQELLHYFPPVVAGVLIPGIVIVSLMVVPYFATNSKRESLWKQNKQKRLIFLTVFVFIFSFISLLFHAYAIAISTMLMYFLAILPYFLPRDKGWLNWLGRRSISTWIMTWFVLLLVILTVIGTFFRGPEWSWIWPWK